MVEFRFPTVVDSGTNAVRDFARATGGAVSFVCAAGTTPMRAAGAWAAPWTVLTPTKVPLGIVAAGHSNGSTNGTFTMTMTCPDGRQSTAVTVTLDTSKGSAPLIYQVDFANGVFTVSPVDVSNSARANHTFLQPGRQHSGGGRRSPSSGWHAQRLRAVLLHRSHTDSGFGPELVSTP
jgi:hypothetical protein